MEWWQEFGEGGAYDFDDYEEDYCEYELMHGDHDWTEPEIVDEIWTEPDKSDKTPIYQRKCRCCGLVQEEPLIVEYWEDKFIEIAGKRYKALKAWGNISVCAECGRVIMDIPLILWDAKDRTMAVTFHFECAEKLGILSMLTKRDETP